MAFRTRATRAALVWAGLMILAVTLVGRTERSSLEEEQLYIVPQANVLTGAGQRPHKQQQQNAPTSPASGADKKAAHTQKLYIVPQANVLTGSGQRPLSGEGAKEHGHSGESADNGKHSKGAAAAAAAAAAEQQLYIVPQANVLTGSGQRPAPKAGEKAVAKKAVAKKVPVSTPPLQPKWTKTQREVHDRVARELAEERERREEAAQKAAKKMYMRSRKSMLAHEERRQERFKSKVHRERLNDSDSIDALRAAHRITASKLHDEKEHAEMQVMAERSDADAHINSHAADLWWQRS